MEKPRDESPKRTSHYSNSAARLNMPGHSTCEWCRTGHVKAISYEDRSVCCNCLYFLDPDTVEQKCSQCRWHPAKKCRNLKCGEERCFHVMGYQESKYCCKCYPRVIGGCTLPCRLCYYRSLAPLRGLLVYFFHALGSDMPILESLWHTSQPIRVTLEVIRHLSYEMTVRRLREMDTLMKTTSIKVSNAAILKVWSAMKNENKALPNFMLFKEPILLPFVENALTYTFQQADRSMLTPLTLAWHAAKIAFFQLWLKLTQFIQLLPLEICRKFYTWGNRLTVSEQPPPPESSDDDDSSALSESYEYDEANEWEPPDEFSDNGSVNDDMDDSSI
jgi:hypothetical protein